MRSSEKSIGLFVGSNQYGEAGPEIQKVRLHTLTLELGRLGTRISVKKYTECKDGINPNGSVKKESSIFVFPPQEVKLSSSSNGNHDKLPDGTIKEFEYFAYDESLVKGKVEVQYNSEINKTASLSIVDRMANSVLPHGVIVAIDQAFPVDG